MLLGDAFGRQLYGQNLPFNTLQGKNFPFTVKNTLL